MQSASRIYSESLKSFLPPNEILYALTTLGPSNNISKKGKHLPQETLEMTLPGNGRCPSLTLLPPAK